MNSYNIFFITSNRSNPLTYNKQSSTVLGIIYNISFNIHKILELIIIRYFGSLLPITRLEKGFIFLSFLRHYQNNQRLCDTLPFIPFHL